MFIKKLYIRYILGGFILVVTGAVVPFSILLGVTQNSYWLNLLGYAASIFGLFMGLFGAIQFGNDNLDE